MSADDDRFSKGLAIAQRLFGPLLGGLRLPDNFRRYTMAHLFGDVWQGSALAIEERSLLTCTVLVALNREAEQRLHFTGAKNLGIPREKIEALITHVAHYAGWPVGVGAFRVLQEVWPAAPE
jgi:4-carboxymuconolactone decarboxylase